LTEITATKTSIPIMPDQFEAAARERGGTDNFATLLAQAAAESNFKSTAENTATGAAGPFQFVQGTWLDLMRKHGLKLGVKSDLVAQIKRDPTTGHLTVSDPKARQALLDLRHDLDLSARTATQYLDENRASLGRQLGRTATDAEVQMSFLLGANGAARLIKTAASDPGKPVDEVLPKAVAANHSLFVEKDGQTRSASAAVDFLAQKFGRDRTRFAAYLNTPPAGTAAKSGKDVRA